MRTATVSRGEIILGRIREGYGSRFGRTYDAMTAEGKHVAGNTTLENAVAKLAGEVI